MPLSAWLQVFPSRPSTGQSGSKPPASLAIPKNLSTRYAGFWGTTCSSARNQVQKPWLIQQEISPKIAALWFFEKPRKTDQNPRNLHPQTDRYRSIDPAPVALQSSHLSPSPLLGSVERASPGERETIVASRGIPLRFGRFWGVSNQNHGFLGKKMHHVPRNLGHIQIMQPRVWLGNFQQDQASSNICELGIWNCRLLKILPAVGLLRASLSLPHMGKSTINVCHAPPNLPVQRQKHPKTLSNARCKMRRSDMMMR